MKLSGFEITNFGCIGDPGYKILIDDIVILIGCNNVGKSTIFEAYEAYASTGKPIALSWFHNENKDLPITLTGIFTDIKPEDTEKLGKGWAHDDPEFGNCIKVRWTWTKPGQNGVKLTWDPTKNDWNQGGVGGFDALIASRVPHPLRVRPTDTPEETQAQIVDILTSTVKASLKSDSNKVSLVLRELESASNALRKEVDAQLKDACDHISGRLQEVFPGHSIEFHDAIGKFEPEKILGAGSFVRVKDASAGTAIPLNQQGAGLRRAFLWSALGSLAETGRIKAGKTSLAERSRILLIEEPEAFLHPPTTRAAREALYKLANVTGWQVMACTHSPVFIDVAKEHTTILRIGRGSAKTLRAFSTDKARFSDDDRAQLSMVRACHPTVNEFFFADHVFLVEGDTEQAALTILLGREGEPVKQTCHVVNCMGKANLALFARILNQFGTRYTVIHDADSPRIKLKNGKTRANAMWTVNSSIVAAVKERDPSHDPASIIAHFPNWEGHYFGSVVDGDKPYETIKHLLSKDFESKPEYSNLRGLVASLLNGTHSNKYTDNSGFTDLYDSWHDDANPEPRELWDRPV